MDPHPLIQDNSPIMPTPRIISFKNQKEFEQINLKGKKIVCKYFILILQKELIDTSKIYLGLKINRKVGNAVKRNKIRRRLKHTMRDFVSVPECSNLLGSRFLIIPKHNIFKAKYAELLQDLNFFAKAEI